MVTRRGGDRHGGFGRCALVAMERAGTEVLRETGRVEGGGRQSCSVAMERVGTRSVVGGFGEKCRDRKGITRLQRGGLGGKGGCQPNKAVIASAYGWDCQSLVYRCRS